MKNEYFQNDVIDLRILGDIGSVCIYRFPNYILSLWNFIPLSDDVRIEYLSIYWSDNLIV